MIEILPCPVNLILFFLRGGYVKRVWRKQSNTGKTGSAWRPARFDDLTGLLTPDASGYHSGMDGMCPARRNAGGKADLSPSLLNGEAECLCQRGAGF